MAYAIPAIGQEPSPDAIQPSYGQVGYAGMPYYQYERYRKAIGAQRDAFEKKHKESRSFLFLSHKKDDAWYKAIGKSVWNAAVAGPINFVQKQLWTKEEGFFPAVRTAATLLIGGAVIAGGFALAPALTAGALAVMSGVGVAIAGVRGVKHGVSWAGNMVTGDYKKAVEDAHDFGDAGAEGALAALGLRQTTSMAMRLNGVEASEVAGAGRFWNLRESFRDFRSTFFGSGRDGGTASVSYWRSGLNELKSNASRFWHDVQLNSRIGNNYEVRALFDSMGQRVTQVRFRDPHNRPGRPGYRPEDGPFMRTVTIDHKLDPALAERLASNEAWLVNVLERPNGSLEMVVKARKPGDLMSLRQSERAAQYDYYTIKAERKPFEKLRIANERVVNSDGTFGVNRSVREVGIATAEGESFTISDNPFVRVGQGIGRRINKVRKTFADLRDAAYERYWSGYSLNSRIGRNPGATEYAIGPHRVGPNGGDPISGRVLTSRQITESEFSVLSKAVDGEITPTFAEKLSGFTQTVGQYLGQGMRAATTQHNVQPGSMAASQQESSIIARHVAREMNVPADQLRYVQLVREHVNHGANQVTRSYFVRQQVQPGQYVDRHVSISYPVGSNGRVRQHFNDNLERLGMASVEQPGPRNFWQRMGDFFSDTQPGTRPTLRISDPIGGRNIGVQSILADIDAGVTTVPNAANALVASGAFTEYAHATRFLTQARRGLEAERLLDPLNIAENANVWRWGRHSNIYSTMTAPLTPGYGGLGEALDFGPNKSAADAEDEAQSQSSLGHSPSTPYRAPGSSHNAFYQPSRSETSSRNPFSDDNYEGRYSRDRRIS